LEGLLRQTPLPPPRLLHQTRLRHPARQQSRLQRGISHPVRAKHLPLQHRSGTTPPAPRAPARTRAAAHPARGHAGDAQVAAPVLLPDGAARHREAARPGARRRRVHQHVPVRRLRRQAHNGRHG
ncbi:hypothetical protein LTR16_012180, partial [Cryomyces antarcticus]